jgi:SAM-dependent methyltransferase
MSGQFDDYAQMYEDMFRLPWRRFLEKFTVLSLLGDLNGRSVLDIGCGTGVYSRELMRQGAARVTGYDVSEGMIEHARRIEDDEPLGIEYVTEPPGEDGAKYDLAVGVYVLPYAESYDALVELCALAAAALRDGGPFVALPINPNYDGRRDYYAQYGFRLYDGEARADGSRVTFELDFGLYHEIITARRWAGETLESALADAGFEDVRWPSYQVSPEGIEAHGPEFWSAYLNCPHTALIACRKKAAGPG